MVQRQKQEFAHEGRVAQEAEQFKVQQKALFENKTAAVIRSNRVRDKALAMQKQREGQLQMRRAMLAEKLTAEQKAYEQEMVDREETPQQRTDKMAVRAYELKKRREDERKAIVQEKLYQQWRSGIDDLRTMDSEIVRLQTIADRDHQLDEKAVRRAEEKAHEEFYAKLWHEGYLAKIDREKEEKQVKEERNAQLVNVLGVQLNMKEARVKNERAEEASEAVVMKQLWEQQEIEEMEVAKRVRAHAREERMKADEYMQIQKEQREDEHRQEREFDRNFVQGVIERERRLAEVEEVEKKKAHKKAVEFTDALKIEMARKAESEEQLIQLQHEESERQWQKRYAQWEKEELARRKLMEEVYDDRAKQLQHKQVMREKLKEDLVEEKVAIDSEVARLEAMEAERAQGELVVAKKHQENLFKQMDHHQVSRQRQLQQMAIEQRQSAIAEHKIQRAVEKETQEAGQMVKDILETRKTNAAISLRAKQATVAPWEK